jgi:hypothetical protein
MTQTNQAFDVHCGGTPTDPRNASMTRPRPTEVEWSVIEHTSLDEWAGTKIRFDVSPAGTNTSTLAFQHEGLSPKLECYEQCEAGWDHSLDSLVAFAECGEGAPFRGRS